MAHKAATVLVDLPFGPQKTWRAPKKRPNVVTTNMLGSSDVDSQESGSSVNRPFQAWAPIFSCGSDETKTETKEGQPAMASSRSSVCNPDMCMAEFSRIHKSESGVPASLATHPCAFGRHSVEGKVPGCNSKFFFGCIAFRRP